MEAASIAHGGHAEHEHHGPPAAHSSSRVEPQLLGMLLFIISEVTVHWAQTAIKKGNRFGLKAGILTTFLLGCTFLFIQINEYANIGFAPQDGAQQTVFYSLTGLHGAHVFIGLLLLLFVTIRSFRGHYSPEEHRGVEVPGIYWHFVDIMWIVVYTTVYVL
jgi:cytochrome c oxidase subunit 3